MTAAMAGQAFLLFVPSYGGGGSGEFRRSVSLAEAAARRWPRARIEFLLPGGPGTRQDAPFPKRCHQGDENSKGAFDREQIRELRPSVVIFDSGCRSETLRLCRNLGIVSAYISDRAGTLRKAFRLDWLPVLDLHWHQREHVTARAFTSCQSALARVSHARRAVFDTYFPENPADWNTLPGSIRDRLQKPFVLFTPGGGGYSIGGKPVAELFLQAAEKVHGASGVECLTLLGALYQGGADGSARTCTLRELPQALFIELLRRAAVVVTNGGHSLNQTLACGAACIAAPLGGDDQPGRIRAYAAAGLIEAGQADAEALSAAALKLATEESRRLALRARVAEKHIVNGIPLMLDELALVPGLR